MLLRATFGLYTLVYLISLYSGVDGMLGMFTLLGMLAFATE